jgi:hypothetical protein
LIEAMRGALACLRRSTCERLPTDARPNTCVTSRHICAELGHICAGTEPHLRRDRTRCFGRCAWGSSALARRCR